MSLEQSLMCNSNILRGVPTNSQVTLTLLRVGEAHRSPLPPGPPTKPSDPNRSPGSIEKVPLSASPQEKLQAIKPASANPSGTNEGEQEKPKHKRLSKVITLLKGNTKAVVNAKLAVNHARRSEKAKGQLGVLVKEEDLIYAGPADFRARLDGKQGWLRITYIASQTHLVFTTRDPRPQQGSIDDSDDKQIIWSMAVKDIHRLKRATAFASKLAEKAADWSEDSELLGSVEIDDENGKTWRFTAIAERDELFNRLVAVGEQRWENM